ncbi:MAG: biosynthetic peptidoglycan transglycosylase, partial [Pseudomonadota bacterium]|nr:biosynthetic peptidoglycan transglycosylase [Pseudomonadota bacterium]
MPRPRTPKKEPEPQKIPLRRRLLVWCFNIFLLACVAVCGYVSYIYLTMPSLDAILHETRDATIVFLDQDGNELRSANRIMGTPVSVETLPPHVWQSIVAIEDKRFFQHGPIDMRGITRAVFFNLASGRVASGGSTITQQTAKNIFLSRKKKISRKVHEL